MFLLVSVRLVLLRRLEVVNGSFNSEESVECVTVQWIRTQRNRSVKNPLPLYAVVKKGKKELHSLTRRFWSRLERSLLSRYKIPRVNRPWRCVTRPIGQSAGNFRKNKQTIYNNRLSITKNKNPQRLIYHSILLINS